MSVNKPRTIDNLGVETSRRYADDRAKLDQKLIDDSRFVPLKTEVSVVKPYLPTDFDAYLNTGRETIWASFAPPPEYAFTKPLFTFQLIPSLGGYEKQEADTDKLEALEDALHKEGKGGSQQNEKERKTILHLLKTIGMLDRTLVLINSRRNQYQRG